MGSRGKGLSDQEDVGQMTGKQLFALSYEAAFPWECAGLLHLQHQLVYLIVAQSSSEPLQCGFIPGFPSSMCAPPSLVRCT